MGILGLLTFGIAASISGIQASCENSACKNRTLWLPNNVLYYIDRKGCCRLVSNNKRIYWRMHDTLVIDEDGRVVYDEAKAMREACEKRTDFMGCKCTYYLNYEGVVLLDPNDNVIGRLIVKFKDDEIYYYTRYSCDYKAEEMLSHMSAEEVRRRLQGCYRTHCRYNLEERENEISEELFYAMIRCSNRNGCSEFDLYINGDKCIVSDDINRIKKKIELEHNIYKKNKEKNMKHFK